MNLELKNKNTFKQQFKKRCFNFSLSIIRLAEILRRKQSNWILIDQLIRSATSIGANIVEGGNSTSKKEFINYFQIALKSASETLYPPSQKTTTLVVDECDSLLRWDVARWEFRRITPPKL